MAIRPEPKRPAAATDQEWREPGPDHGRPRRSSRLPGTGSPMRWFFSAIWLVYLIQPGRGPVRPPPRGGVDRRRPGHHGRLLRHLHARPHVLGRAGRGWPGTGSLAIAVLSALACVVYGNDWTPLWIYVSAATGMVLAAAPDGRRAAMLGVAAVGACYVFFCWLSHETLDELP